MQEVKASTSHAAHSLQFQLKSTTWSAWCQMLHLLCTVLLTVLIENNRVGLLVEDKKWVGLLDTMLPLCPAPPRASQSPQIINIQYQQVSHLGALTNPVPND
jgi:hypothetical protein